jgi:hypothetical protein
VTDGNLHVTTFEYNNNADGVGNGFDLKDKITYPGGSYEAWTYDANKNVLSRRTTAGEVQVFAYMDNRDRMTNMNWGGEMWGNGLPYENIYSYDAAGRMLTANNGVSEITRSYDAAGRLETESETFLNSGLPTHSIKYVHRDDGNVTSVQVDPADPVDLYHFLSTYDGMGRLQTLMNAHDTGKDYEYVYDHASNVIQRFNWLGGGQVFNTFDNLSRMTQRDIELQNGTVWSSEHYGFDPMNRETSVSRDEDGSVDTFTYNYSGEMTSAQYGAAAPPPTPTPTATPTPTPAVATPTFNPVAGAYPASDYPKTVTISTTTTGANMRYTTDGTTPSSTVGTLIAASSGTASVPAGATLKAIAFKSGMTNSAIKSGVFSVAAAVATPTYNPVAAPYPFSDYPKTVTISTTTTGANMRYTTDGTTPSSTAGTLIAASSGTASVPAGVTLKAIAFKSGMTNSAISSGFFGIAGAVATPTFNPIAGGYPASDFPKTVTISTATTGANMRYTTNGTTPSSTVGTLIPASSGTASVPEGATLKAIGFKSGLADSAIKSGVFSTLPLCAAPVLNPANVISGPVPPTAYTVNVSTTTSGASMSYTKDGSTPTPTHGTIVGTNVNVTIAANTVISLNAITFKSGYTDSDVTSGYFDNQNGGGNQPRHKKKQEEQRKAPRKSADRAERSKASKMAQSAASSSSLRERERLSLARFHFDLWNSAALRNDPGLSLSWERKNKKQRQESRQGDTNQTNSTRIVNYTLDNMGNRTQVVDAGVTKSYVVNNLNQYTTGHGVAVTNGSSHEISVYNGTSYQYIGDSYLAKATAGTNTYTLFYDALGRCVKRTTVINGGTPTTNYYLFDGEHWVMDYDQTGANHNAIIYGREVDELIARGVDGVGWFYFPDRNGNISVVTDGVNTIRESYRYDAFGLPTISTEEPGE